MNAQRLIFLDIDGVLNSQSYMHTRYEARGHKGAVRGDSEREFWLEMLDPVAMGRLDLLVESTNSFIIISSTWRKNNTVPALQSLFAEKGLQRPNRIIGATPSLGTLRGHEIQAWIDERYAHGNGTIESFVILDDDRDMVHLGNRLIWTPNRDGLLEEHVQRAREILTLQPWSDNGVRSPDCRSCCVGEDHIYDPVFQCFCECHARIAATLNNPQN